VNGQPDITEDLLDEIARYLAAVDVFRAEACEPTWLPEPSWSRVDAKPVRDLRDQVRATH
jgi:hypothetical protein